MDGHRVGRTIDLGAKSGYTVPGDIVAPEVSYLTSAVDFCSKHQYGRATKEHSVPSSSTKGFIMSSDVRASTTREVQREDGTTIQYSVSGQSDGKILVLVHGWACSRQDFEGLISYLPADYRVIAVDLAEHGESRSTRSTWTIEEFGHDVAAVLDKETVQDCIMVGHSMGGAVALEAARLVPEAVAHVVTFDALHYLFLFPAVDDQQSKALLEPFQRDFPAAVRGMVEAGSPAGTEAALKESHYQRMLAVRQPAGVLSMEALVHWDMDRTLAEVTQPVTLFAVRELLSEEAIDRYGERIRIVPVDLGSHHFPRESPEGTARLLTEIANG
jgi:pimeloyl-ACP methyl ester carboxylesterase